MLKDDPDIFLKSTKPKELLKKGREREKKALTLKSAILLLKWRQKFLHAFEKGIFP